MSFKELAKALGQASEICSKLSENDDQCSSSNSTSGVRVIPPSTFANMASTSAAVSQAVQRARSMIGTSTQRGVKRLTQRERLRAGGKVAKAQPKEEIKPYEFVLVHVDESDENEQLALNEDSTLLRGFVQLNTSASEAIIREEICNAINKRYPMVTSRDFEFLKANRRKLIKPVSSCEYNFQQVKLLAGQGAIYVKIKDGFDCLLGRDEHSDDGLDKSIFDSPVKSPQTNQININDKSAQNNKKQLTPEVEEVINHCLNNDITDPVEILRVAQNKLVTGRSLEVRDPTASDESGQTNFILVNRRDVFKSAVEELESYQDLRPTLEVTFYGETAKDLGGPRKEFFRLCLKEIESKYFEKGLREHLADDYKNAGSIMALSFLQNGCIPTFMSEDILQELFVKEKPSLCIRKLREGFERLGIYSICSTLPILLHLFRPSPSTTLSRMQLVHLLKPDFSEEGSNARLYETEAYSSFMTYVREVAAGRREEVTLEKILQFVTCADQEPVLGFGVEPAILFICASNSSKWSFLPCAHTCSNRLELRRGYDGVKLPSDEDLFEVFDHAFCNAYFGKM